MKKTSLFASSAMLTATVLLAGAASAASAASAANAATTTITTNGTAGFYTNYTPVVPPTNPTDPTTPAPSNPPTDITPGTPGDPSTPVGTTPPTPGTPGTPSNPGSETPDGLMAFFAPNLNFGYHPVKTGANQNYDAYAQPFSFTDPTTSTLTDYAVEPQDVQVNDSRGTEAGWNVTVEESQQFTSDTNAAVVLKGATITFNVGGGNNTALQGQSANPASLTNGANNSQLVLNPADTTVGNTAQTIYAAALGTGDGINQLIFGTNTATPTANGTSQDVTKPVLAFANGVLDTSIVNGNPTDNRGAGTGNGTTGFVNYPASVNGTAQVGATLNPFIQLNVMANTEAATSYTAQLTWSLNNTPS